VELNEQAINPLEPPRFSEQWDQFVLATFDVHRQQIDSIHLELIEIADGHDLGGDDRRIDLTSRSGRGQPVPGVSGRSGVVPEMERHRPRNRPDRSAEQDNTGIIPEPPIDLVRKRWDGFEHIHPTSVPLEQRGGVVTAVTADVERHRVRSQAKAIDQEPIPSIPPELFRGADRRAPQENVPPCGQATSNLCWLHDDRTQSVHCLAGMSSIASSTTPPIVRPIKEPPTLLTIGSR
jgi:hypothetical protein